MQLIFAGQWYAILRFIIPDFAKEFRVKLYVILVIIDKI